MRQPDPSNSEFNFPKTTCRESFSPGGLSTSSQHARRGSSQLYSKLLLTCTWAVCVCVCVCSGLAVESHLQSGRVQTAGRARLPPPTPPCLLLLASVSHLPLPERGWCWYLKLGAGRSALSSPSLSLPWYGYSTVPRRSHDDDEHHHHHRAHAHAHHHQPHHHHHHHHHHHYNRHHHHHYHYHQQEPWLQLPAPPRPPTDEERM